MSSLVAISNVIMELTQLLDNCYTVDEETGELLPTNQEQINQIELMLKDCLQTQIDKVTSFVNYLQALDSEVERVDKAIDAARKYKKRIESRQEWLKLVAASAMKALDCKRIDGEHGKYISMRASEQVVVDCLPQDLPEKFVRVKYEADKPEIKKALKAGKEIEGCKLKPNQTIIYK
jgi:hypothetical protein